MDAQKKFGWPEILGALTGTVLGLVGAAVIWFAWDFIKHVFTAH